MNKDEQERSREAIKRLVATTEEFRNSVVPLFGYQERKAIQDRTGILFQIADDRFVITAAHDLDWISEHVPIFVAPHAPGIEPFQLTGRMTGTECKTVDVAIMKLNEEDVARLIPARTFLRMTVVDFRSRHSKGIYVVQGYPTELGRIDESERKVRTRGVRYFADLYDGEPDPSSDYPYDPEIHLLLGHNKDGLDLDGRPIKTPHPKGMSGGAIWRVTEGKFTSSEPKLVAIQTKGKAGSFLKGTWIKYPLELIAKTYPELRRVMTLYA